MDAFPIVWVFESKGREYLRLRGVRDQFLHSYLQNRQRNHTHFICATMGLFSKKKQDESAQTDVKSDVTSLSQSGAPSMKDPEKTEASPTTATDGTEIGDDKNMAEKKIEGMQKEADQQDEDETEYPKSTKLALITIALCLSVFCMALDNTIISTAIPRITDEFKAIDDVGWYGS